MIEVTWRYREHCHLGKPSAWCSPWWCHEWRSALSAQRRHQEPRSSSPAVSRTCGSGCFPREKPGARPSSSASGTESWWSPEEETGTTISYRVQIQSHAFWEKWTWCGLPCWPRRCCLNSPPERRCPREWPNLWKRSTVKRQEVWAWLCFSTSTEHVRNQCLWNRRSRSIVRWSLFQRGHCDLTVLFEKRKKNEHLSPSCLTENVWLILQTLYPSAVFISV